MPASTKSFELSNENPIQEFSLENPISSIVILKIIAESLMDKQPTEWYFLISKYCLEITYTTTRNSYFQEKRFFANNDLIPNNPIFYFYDFEIPSQEARDENEIYKHVRILLKPTVGKHFTDKILLVISFDTTAGVVKIENITQ